VDRRDIRLAVALAALCLIVFGQAAHFDFINYDDNAYVSENAWVRGGFTGQGIRWAFTSIDYFYWQPLTWLSHMLDCQLFGLRPGWHHLGNVILHIANCILVFLIFRRLTGAFWRSAVLAALFAVHPLRLESVVWIAERKDVLSTLWCLVTVRAYLWYVERPGDGRYLAVLAAFACGLMSKPMLITLPVLLAVLDSWPLKRRAWAEKLPLAMMALVTLAVTYLGTSHMGSLNWAARIPLGHRIANALVNYAAYLAITLWPRHLAILYPYRLAIPLWQPVAAAALLAAVTLAVFRWRMRFPYLLAGWAWFMVAILPPIGVVQVGRQAMADRFTYLPSIGLTLMAVWGGAELLKYRRALAATAAAAAVAACAAASLVHIGTWRDSVAVWENAIVVTGGNPAAQHYLASALDGRGRYAESLPHHAEAVRLEPDYFIAQNAYALCLERTGDLAAAADHFAAAIRYFPAYADARFHLGLDLERLGRAAEARKEFEEALRIGLSGADARTAREHLSANP